MTELEKITEIVSEKGSSLNLADLSRIKMLSVDVPLADSEALAFAFEGVALIVNDPLYGGDIPPIE